MKINDLRIGVRLALAFGTILVLLAVISAVNIVQLQHIQADTDAMEGAADRERLAHEWLRAIETNVVRIGAAARTADAAEEKRYKDEIASTRDRVNQLQKELEHAVTSDKGRQLMRAIAERRKAYLNTRDTILAAKVAAGAEGALAISSRIDSEFVPLAKDYVTSVNVLVAHLKDEFMAAHDDLHARSSNGQILLLSASGVSLLLGALLAWWLTRSITRPLNQGRCSCRGRVKWRSNKPNRSPVAR